jgi:hypothetical protein
MPRCPLCGSTHIVVSLRPVRRGYCLGCDLTWGLDGSASPAAATLGAATGAESSWSGAQLPGREVTAGTR